MGLYVIVEKRAATPRWVPALGAALPDATPLKIYDQEDIQVGAADIVLLLAPLPHLAARAAKLVQQQARVFIVSAPEALPPMAQRHHLEAIAEDVGASFIDLNTAVALAKDRSNAAIAKYLLLRIRPAYHTDQYFFGASTYPEVWSPDVMQHDINEMRKLGMNATRIGEFTWQMIEPQPGRYHFEWLHNCLNAFKQAGISVLLAIPTPTPPRWLTAGHPERCVVNEAGQVMAHGSRQHVCLNNAVFRGYALQMTEKLVQAASQHDNVLGFQLDNEFKAHVDQCFCTSCREQWHTWLAAEYGDIDHLNEVWGTAVWSEVYAAFDEVPQPSATPFLHNSALQNDYRRFTTAGVEQFAELLADTIREYSALPITHNSAMGFNLDNHRLFSRLDFAGFDTYASSGNYPAYTLNLDLWRNLLPADYMLLETSPSHGGSLHSYGLPHPHGYLANELFLNFAADSHGFNIWHMRGQRFGVEQPHGAVLTAWGEPDIGYPEVQAAGQVFQELLPHLRQTSFARPSVALMYADEAKRFYTIETGGIYDYRRLITAYYTALLKAGISVDVIQPSARLEDYAVVLAPYVRHVSQALCTRFDRYVQSGGRLILGPMTADRTAALTWPATNGLDQVGQWLGLHEIKQFRVAASAQWDGLVTVFTPPTDWQVKRRADNGQAVVATKGKVTYVGGLPKHLSEGWWAQFIQQEILPLDVDQAWLRLASGLVKYRRDGAGFREYFIANMTDQAQAVTLQQAGTINGQPVSGSFALASYDRVIIRMEESEV